MKNTNFEKQLIEMIGSYYQPFNQEQLTNGLKKFEKISLLAGDHLIKTGEIADKIFITEKSITRNYTIDENNEEKIIWIESEMRFLADFESFKTEQPTQYNIQVYEDTDVYYITKTNLLELYHKYHDWALFGINILEEYLLHTFVINNKFLNYDATEKYNYIETYFPRFLKIVPLKHISSRLNISQVTVSRIRAEKNK